MITHEYALPLPTPTVDDETFWEGCKRHELLIPQCAECGALRSWDLVMCPQCNALETKPMRACGRGTVWSFTVTRHAFTPPWKGAVPYTVVVVDLEEGPRIISNLIDAEEEEITLGAPVEVLFEDVTPEWTLPKFRLVR